MKKMDPDNLAKIVLDSATKLVWADDAQVSMLTVGKIIGRQGDAPRTIMMVKEIDHDPVTLWRSKWESQ